MNFNSLFALIGKDLKMFFRSRVSSAVVILIPLLIVIFSGYAFNSSELSNVQVGVYSEGYTDFTDSLISDLESDGFFAKRYDSSELCLESVKHSDSQICVVFPANLNEEASDSEIIFYVDYSRINLADNLINEIEGNVFVKTSGVGESIAQNLIDSLEAVQASLPGAKVKVDETLRETKNGSEMNSALEFSTENITVSIDMLEDIKDGINDSDSTSKDAIDEVIVMLTEIEEDGERLSDNLGSIEHNKNSVVVSLSQVSIALDGLIKVLDSRNQVDADDVVSPIKTRIESVSTDFNNRDYMVPIIFSLIALFGSILLSSTFVLKGKKTKAFFRNFMTPTKDIVFVVATYITCLIILFAQFLLVFVGVKYILNMEIFAISGPLLVLLFFMISAFVAIGMFIGYLFRSDETVVFASMIIAALFMFFSNVILPLENISGGMMKFLKINPLVVSNLALKKVVLFGLGFGAIWGEVLILFGFFAVFFGLAYVFRRITRRIL